MRGNISKFSNIGLYLKLTTMKVPFSNFSFQINLYILKNNGLGRISVIDVKKTQLVNKKFQQIPSECISPSQM